VSDWRALSLLAFLLLPHPVRGATVPAGEPRDLATPAARASELETLAYEIQSLRAGIEDLHDAMRRPDAAPPWAERAHQQLLQRVERLQAMQERLAARVETPVPRLDEPIVLLTVGGATLVLGFVAGRTVQRRSSRRDRFRL
jgi:hypothetical protein